MSKTGKVILSLAVLGIAYVVYRRFRARRKGEGVFNTVTNGPQIGDGGLVNGGGDPTLVPCAPVAMDYGCDATYNNTCGSINFINPSINTGCCGEQVYRFQCALNQRQAFGLVEDGKYGPATLQAHEAIRSQQAIPPSFPGVNFSF